MARSTEASHITRTAFITWNETSLLNLVVRRLLTNPVIRSQYGIANPASVLTSVDEQEKFFYRVFPDKVEVGPNKPNTFRWIVGRTRDGKQLTAPRELIHLLNAARDKQLERLQLGQDSPSDESLIDRTAIKEALPEVSSARLNQTLYAEYPNLRPFLQKLERKRTAQTDATLAEIWAVSLEDARKTAERLVEVGFFEKRSDGYWVPFLYRFALNMVQGAEDSNEDDVPAGAGSRGEGNDAPVAGSGTVGA